MSFLAPIFFFVSLAVAAVIAALHFIVVRQPRAAILPTARFVPDTRATTVAEAKRPSDLLLMLLRMLIVLAAGAGLAKPVLTPSRGAEARVILVDVSRSTRDSIAIRDSVRAIYRNGDAVVLFDSSARLVAGNAADSLGALGSTSRRGNLSAALIAALRAGSSLRDHADSLDLVMVSPFAREELDTATDSIRKLWPGRATLVRVGQPTVDTAGVFVTPGIRIEANDPLAVTIALAGKARTGDRQREPGNRERVAASGPRKTGNGERAAGSEPLIEWPASSRPRFAIQRAVRDTVGGVAAGEAIVVSAFDRQWSFPRDSLHGADVIARWADGEPAAIEKPDGTGCVRSVAIPVTPVGDLVIRNDFVRFVATLSRPCAAITSLTPADPAVVTSLEGRGGLAPREGFQPLTDARSELAPWLLALAIAAAMAELFVRRRGTERRLVSSAARSASREARAA